MISTQMPLTSITQPPNKPIERQGLLKTPERVAKAMLFMTHGYDWSVEEILNEAVFHEEQENMVVVKVHQPGSPHPLRAL